MIMSQTDLVTGLLCTTLHSLTKIFATQTPMMQQRFFLQEAQELLGAYRYSSSEPQTVTIGNSQS